MNETIHEDANFPIKMECMDRIEDILSLTDVGEMDTIINKNTITLTKIFKAFHKRLCDNFELTKEEADILIYCLKFVDMLNLFMTNQSIDSILKLIYDINELIKIIGNLEFRETIIKKIKYTEMTIIYYKKKFFKFLFFGDGKTLGTEIENCLNQVTQEGLPINYKLFKQMQNIFYVVQTKIEENYRKELQIRLSEMKEVVLSYKKDKFKKYEDFNDYADYKDFTNLDDNIANNNPSGNEYKEYSNYNYNNYNEYNDYNNTLKNYEYNEYYYNNNEHMRNYYNNQYYYTRNNDKSRDYKNYYGNYVNNYGNSTPDLNCVQNPSSNEKGNEVPSSIYSNTGENNTNPINNNHTRVEKTIKEKVNNNNSNNNAKDTSKSRKESLNEDPNNSNNIQNNKYNKSLDGVEIISTVLNKRTNTHANTNSNAKNTKYNQSYYNDNFFKNYVYYHDKPGYNSGGNTNNTKDSNVNNSSTVTNTNIVNDETPVKKNKNQQYHKHKYNHKYNNKQTVTQTVEIKDNNIIANNADDTKITPIEQPTITAKEAVDGTEREKEKENEVIIEKTIIVKEDKKDYSNLQSNLNPNRKLNQYYKNNPYNNQYGKSYNNNYNYNNFHNANQYSSHNTYNSTIYNKTSYQYNTYQTQYTNPNTVNNQSNSNKTYKNEESNYSYVYNQYNPSNYNTYSNRDTTNQRHKSISYSNKYFKNNPKFKHEFVDLSEVEKKNIVQENTDNKEEIADKVDSTNSKEVKNIQEETNQHQEDKKYNSDSAIEPKQNKDFTNTNPQPKIENPNVNKFVELDVEKMFAIDELNVKQSINLGNDNPLSKLMPLTNSNVLEKDTNTSPVTQEVNGFNKRVVPEKPEKEQSSAKNVSENNQGIKENNNPFSGDDVEIDHLLAANDEDSEEENELDELNHEEQSDSDGGEENSGSESEIDENDINEEFDKFIKETANIRNSKNYTNDCEYNDYTDVEGATKNNKIIFEDDDKAEDTKRENDNKKEDTENIQEDVNESEKLLNNDMNNVHNEKNNNLDNEYGNLKESTKAFMDSLKNIDPKVLSEIKNKLNLKQEEDINSSNNKDNQTANINIIANTNQTPAGLIANPWHLYAQRLSLYNNNNSINKLFLQNHIFVNYAHFFFRGRDSNIHREYFSLKCLEYENPHIISKNLENFESKILIPIYQRINFNVNKKKGVYFYTFTKYKKLIYLVLNKDKILKKVKPYGSYMNNFLIDSGDIDICIVPKCGILEFSTYLEKIKEKILKLNYGEHKLTHHNSRYMLLKVMDHQTKFVIDITVHNMLPILNTNLIRLYSLFDQRFHILGLYLKHWVKINKIHGAADNYLSSYALLLMLISFLQNVVEPRVLPNLQKIEMREASYEYIQNGETIKINTYYEEDVQKIRHYMKNVNNGKENKDNAITLLVKFLEYYSYYFNHYDQKVSITKDIKESLKKKTDNVAFSIEDPFDPTHNPGKSMAINSIQFNKFITSMKKEINMIMTGEYLKRLDKFS